MSGGIIQLNCSKDNNIFLNCNPEITFFKKKYKKYTNFGSEYKYIKFNESKEYGKELMFNINIQGDLLHRCFLEIDIPEIKFTDSIINDSSYTNYKNNLLSSIQTKIDNWNTKYTNMKNFCSIEIIYYNELIELLSSDNVTINILQGKILELDLTSDLDDVGEVNSLDTTYIANSDTWTDDEITQVWSELVVDYDSTNKLLREEYILSIDTNIFDKIDIVSYINDLEGSESVDEIIKYINKKYNLMQTYLHYYHSNKIYQEKIYDENDNVKIKYGWSENLGHYYFSNYRIEFNGTIIDSYDSDQLNIFQSINVDNKENYNEMIGNTSSIYKFGNHDRESKKLYIPLIFWFCRDSDKSLPLIASKKFLPKLYLQINKLKNILYFKDWESEYNNLLFLDIQLEDHQKNSNESIKIYTKLNYESVEIILPEYIYRYKCTKINKKFLDLKYPGIDSELILNSYGIYEKEEDDLILDKNNYIYMMNNISNDTNLSKNDKIKLAGYQYFLDYNYLYKNIIDPDIKLLGEYIYLDKLERDKFCTTKLEYLVELFSKEEFEINEKKFLKYEMNKDILLKNLFWFARPKNISLGLFDNSKVYNGIYTNNLFYDNNIINKIDLLFSNYNLLSMNNFENYYDILKPYEYLENKLPDGVSFKNLSLYPKNAQPSGSFNLSKIKDKVINLTMNNNFFTEYYDNLYNDNSLNIYDNNIELKLLMTNYNILIFENYQAKLIFYHK